MSFLFSLYFIKANVPTPALVVKPVSNAPKLLYVLYNNYIYNVYKDGKYRLEGET